MAEFGSQQFQAALADTAVDTMKAVSKQPRARIRSMAATQRILLAVVALLLFGCGGNPSPDAVLFSRANDALDKGHFDVALLDLVALVNTYPNLNTRNKQNQPRCPQDPVHR